MEECKIKKETTEEQVQDRLQEDGVGNSGISFKTSTWNGAMTWVALGIIAFAIAMVIICVI